MEYIKKHRLKYIYRTVQARSESASLLTIENVHSIQGMKTIGFLGAVNNKTSLSEH